MEIFGAIVQDQNGTSQNVEQVKEINSAPELGKDKHNFYSPKPVKLVHSSKSLPNLVFTNMSTQSKGDGNKIEAKRSRSVHVLETMSDEECETPDYSDDFTDASSTDEDEKRASPLEEQKDDEKSKQDQALSEQKQDTVEGGITGVKKARNLMSLKDEKLVDALVTFGRLTQELRNIVEENKSDPRTGQSVLGQERNSADQDILNKKLEEQKAIINDLNRKLEENAAVIEERNEAVERLLGKLMASRTKEHFRLSKLYYMMCNYIYM